MIKFCAQFVTLTLFLLIATGCRPLDEVSVNPNPNQGEPGTQQQYQQTNYQQQPGNVLIGSFNIKHFGVTKMSRPEVVSVLVDIARKFDVLAIQELRDGDEVVIREFLQLVNRDGGRYAAAVGPKQGYVVAGKLANYYEKAIFLYDMNKVELISQTYVANDPGLVMHRAPYVGHFRCLNVPPEQAFSFVLMNVHVDPDVVHVEFKALQDIIAGVYANHRGEDDFMLIGDLNAEPDKYMPYRWMQRQFSAIPSNWKTNTRQNRCIDNIVFDATFTSEFTGESGVLDIMNEYNLTYEQAVRVSDHMPVWANFSNLEAPMASMTQGGNGVIR